MRANITIEVPGGLTEQEQSDLRFLLADAFSEFAAARALPLEYVAQRYLGRVIIPRELWSVKIDEVQRRADLARKLHAASLGFSVTHDPGLAPGHVISVSDFHSRRLDLLAARALLELLEGHFDRWIVSFQDTTWLVTGPEGQQACWVEGAWIWLDERPVAREAL